MSQQLEMVIASLEALDYTVVPIDEKGEVKQIYTERDLEDRFQLTDKTGKVTTRSQSYLIDLGEKNGWI